MIVSEISCRCPKCKLQTTAEVLEGPDERGVRIVQGIVYRCPCQKKAA